MLEYARPRTYPTTQQGDGSCDRLLRGPAIRILLVIDARHARSRRSPTAAPGPSATTSARPSSTRPSPSSASRTSTRPRDRTAFDCSGLVQYCYNAAGIYVPHQSGIIWSRCDPIAIGRLEPGDLVFRTNLADPYAAADEAARHPPRRHLRRRRTGASTRRAPARTSATPPSRTSTSRGRLRRSYWPLSDSTYDPPPLVRGDFTGDGKDDACYFYGLGGAAVQAYVLPSNGTTLGPIETWFAAHALGLEPHQGRRERRQPRRQDRPRRAVRLRRRHGEGVGLHLGRDSFRPAVWWTSATGGWSWAAHPDVRRRLRR